MLWYRKTTLPILSLAHYHSRSWLNYSHAGCFSPTLTYKERQARFTDINLKGYFHGGKVTGLTALQSPAHVWSNLSLLQENCQPVSELINLSETVPGTHRHKSAHARNSNKYLSPHCWWSFLNMEPVFFGNISNWNWNERTAKTATHSLQAQTLLKTSFKKQLHQRGSNVYCSTLNTLAWV